MPPFDPRADPPDSKPDHRQEIDARLKALNTEQEERLAKRRAEQFHMPYVNLFGFPIEADDLAIVSKAEAKEAVAVLFYKRGTDVRMGVVNPQDPEFRPLVKKIEDELGTKVQLHVISHHSWQVAMSRYGERPRETVARDTLKVTKQSMASAPTLLEKISKVGTGGVTMAPTEVLEALVAGALVRRASDIHIEPRAKRAQLRYRIDGVLQDVIDFDRQVWQQILSRLKIMAQMKLNVRDVPQDGSLVAVTEEGKLDIRLSILPGGFGEFIVMRILSRRDQLASLKELGMKERDYRAVLEELKQSTGLILVAGPTGSGKTTTAMACLKEVNRSELKIITLEDPIEYRLDGIEHTQINEDAGYTFAVGLRSLLRQDPDVLFVGEMRDVETADISVNAALTGHLVFSTLHTNDAPGAILRLESLGVAPYVIGPALNMVIAQRLVRIVCEKCAQTYVVSEKLREHIRSVMTGVLPAVFDPKVLDNPKLTFVKAEGCEECNMTGYIGRIGVFELFSVKGEVEEAILQGADTKSIRAAAVRGGMTTIAQDAYLKVIEGVTTVEEVERISEE